MAKITDIPRMLQIANNAGWIAVLIMAVLTLPIWFFGQRCTDAGSSSAQGKSTAAQDGTSLSGDEAGDPAKWKASEREAPKRPELKPLTAEQREQGIAEDAAFRKQAYAAYEAALLRDAASNPELRAVMDLRAETAVDVEKLSGIRARIRSWQSVSPGQGPVLNTMKPVTGMLATVKQMEDERMRAALGDPTPDVKKGLAISLVDHGIAPAAVMDGGTDAAALSSLREQLFRKIDEISARPGLPADLFNRSTGALLVSEDLHGKLGARAKALATPVTRELADQAAKDVAVHRKEMDERAQEQMRKNAAENP